jgi:hypothetical protein
MPKQTRHFEAVAIQRKRGSAGQQHHRSSGGEQAKDNQHEPAFLVPAADHPDAASGKKSAACEDNKPLLAGGIERNRPWKTARYVLDLRVRH